MFKKSRIAVSDNFDFIFNHRLYIIFKRTIMTFAFKDGISLVPIKVFNKEIVKQFNVLNRSVSEP